MNIVDNYLLEIKALQVKDTKNAFEQNFFNKRLWFEYIINQNQDLIAEEILELSKRYEIPVTTAAYHFDISMLFRVKNLLVKK